MLDTDIYVNHSTLKINTIEGMIEHLKKTLEFEGRDLQDAILVLCAYSFYLTNEEISFLFPIYPAFTHISTRVFSPLVRKGYLASDKTNVRKDMEGTARVFYYVTAQGYQYANSLCHGKLTSKYKKNRAKIAKSHTYYIGYNFIQLMMLGFPMTWQREHLLGTYNYATRNLALQVDGYCELYESFGNKSFYRLFVEQDLCTEHNEILVGKLQNYAEHGMMDYPAASMIVFSLSQKGVTLAKNGSVNIVHPYNESKCNQLLDYMKEMALDDVYDAYVTGYPDQSYITNLMLKIGAAKESKNGLKRGAFKADAEFIKEFRDLINQNTNPYQHRDFNIIRSIAARSRLEEMVKLLYSHMNSNELFLARMRRGYQIYYVATTLLADRLKYAMLSKFRPQQKALEESLSIFGSPHFQADLSDVILLTKGIKLNLRNSFVTDRTQVYVEFPSADVGAWIRAAHFHKLLANKEKKVLILVFETRQQLADFYNANDCYAQDFNTKNGGLLCLMLYDIGKRDKLFYLKDETMKRTYIS